MLDWIVADGSVCIGVSEACTAVCILRIQRNSCFLCLAHDHVSLFPTGKYVCNRENVNSMEKEEEQDSSV
jgi:hypothetical protein